MGTVVVFNHNDWEANNGVNFFMEKYSFFDDSIHHVNKTNIIIVF